MSTYWEITLSAIRPFPGKADELLSRLKGYRFDLYDFDAEDDAETNIDASFYGDGSYWRAEDLRINIAPLIESGTMHAKCEDSEGHDVAVVIVFKNGACEVVPSQSFTFYDGIDDPLKFAKELPDSVIQAILANADVFKSAQ